MDFDFFIFMNSFNSCPLLYGVQEMLYDNSSCFMQIHVAAEIEETLSISHLWVIQNVIMCKGVFIICSRMGGGFDTTLVSILAKCIFMVLQGGR